MVEKMELVPWDEINHQIATEKDIKVLISINNRLEAIRVLSKQTKQSAEVQNKVAEYKLRCGRKIGEWLKENLREGNPQLSTASTVKLNDIGISRDESSKWQMVAKLDKNEFENYLTETKKTNDEITKAGLISLAKKIIREDKIEEQKENIEEENIQKPTGLYDVIVVDPPWSYGTENAYDSESFRGTAPYPTMQQTELLEIELPAKDDCVLWLWTTNTHIPYAYELLEEWGFAPKTILTWNKVHIGIGRYLRNVTEHCILAIKGSPVWTNKTYSTLLTEKRTEHSTKPELFYKMVDEICIGKKLDYFARKKRSGWDVYGDEIK